MKILFAADLHIKVGQKNVPREWQKDRYKMLFDHLEVLQEEAELVVLGGDIFDKIPNMEELELYFDLVSRFDTETIIFDGNHEATRKGRTFLTNLASATSALNHYVYIIDSPYKIKNMDFIPYTNIKKFDPKDYTGRYLFTHVRGRIDPHVKPEIDLEKLSRWERVWAGDLHAHSNSQLNIIYPGSPLSTSFHRKPISNGVIIIDTDDNTYEWLALELPQLIRKTIENPEDAIPGVYDHVIYEVVGNMAELSGINTENDLIDKKIINKTSDASLSLGNMTIAQELVMYMKEVLEIKKDNIEKIMVTYNDYITEP